MRAVDLKQTGQYEISIEWMGGSTNDMVADSVLALLMGIDTSPASVKSISLMDAFVEPAKFPWYLPQKRPGYTITRMQTPRRITS